MPDKLSPLEMDILADLLVHGDNSPKNIAENTGRHRTATQRRVLELVEKELAVNKGSGVYGLTVEGVNAARAILRARRNNR